jgi:hypothetical protein
MSDEQPHMLGDRVMGVVRGSGSYAVRVRG